MFVIGLGTAAPSTRYTQLQCWEALQTSEQFNHLTGRSRAILKKVLSASNGIATRHLALEPLQQAFDITPDALHARFVKHAPTLATTAAERALEQSGVAAAQIDALLISTCTGYLCPGLTSYVAERLSLRPDAVLLDLVGQGCGAALPNLRTAHSLIHSMQAKHVLSVCVEVCSAAFYLDDDPGVLISACLFGDGAGAAVLSGTPRSSGRTVEWLGSASVNSPAERDLLRFESKGGLLRNVLTPQVPNIAADFAEAVLRRSLKQFGRTKDEITTWIFHAGGRDVLMALQQRLQLAPEDLCWSARILQDYGNLSSPFVYFVLKSALDGNAPDGPWWLASFGAGFSSHGALLQVS